MTSKNISLNNIPSGMSVTVKDITSQSDIRRRLLDMGFTQRAHIMTLYKSPFGDPTAYLVRGAVVALREEDSSNISVLEEKQSQPDHNRVLVC